MPRHLLENQVAGLFGAVTRDFQHTASAGANTWIAGETAGQPREVVNFTKFTTFLVDFPFRFVSQN